MKLVGWEGKECPRLRAIGERERNGAPPTPAMITALGAWSRRVVGVSEVAVAFHGYGRVGRSVVRSVGRSPERDLALLAYTFAIALSSESLRELTSLPVHPW